MMQVAVKPAFSEKGKLRALLVGNAKEVEEQAESRQFTLPAPAPKQPAPSPNPANSAAQPYTLPKRPTVSLSGVQSEPNEIEGEAFERMKADPEVREMKRKFITGIIAVCSLVVLTVTWNFLFAQPPVKKVVEEHSNKRVVREKAGRNRHADNSIGMRKATPEPGTAELPDLPSELNFENNADKPAAQAAPPTPPPAAPEPIRIQLNSVLASDRAPIQISQGLDLGQMVKLNRSR